AGEQGLRAAAPGGELFGDLARDMVELARGGLVRRGHGEERFLDPVLEVAQTGRTFADRAKDAFHKGGVVALLRSAVI
ncbi:MAG: hypothetical protein ACYS22_18275, partial [Planctomycetota bacterium]